MTCWSRTPGTRVYAMRNGDDHHVYLFGFGTYEGDFTPPGWARTGLGEVKYENPRIRLDDGKTVWGFECWWGPESEWPTLVEKYAPRTVVVVDVDDYHAEVQAASEEAAR